MTTELIDCTPDYEALFRRFIGEIAHEAIGLRRQLTSTRFARNQQGDHEQRLEMARRMTSLLAAISVATSTTTNSDQLEELRDAVAEALRESNQTLDLILDEP